MLTSLQTARRHLGYTAAQVIDLLARRADALNLPIASRASLKTKLSRWENAKEQPRRSTSDCSARSTVGQTLNSASPTNQKKTPKQPNYDPDSL
jgi:hypothetical protein